MSTPIKTTSMPERHLSGKKLNISKIKATHLLFDLQDWQEKARKSVEVENQAATSDRTSGKKRGSSGELPHRFPAMLPNLSGGDELPTVPLDLTPEAPKKGTKCPHHDDDEIKEIPDEGEPAGPPKKKKKKKKSRETSKDEVPLLEDQDGRACLSTSMAEPEVIAEEPMPVLALSGVLVEETKVPEKKKKKKKNKEANLEKFQLEQREAKAKEMAKAKHWPNQHEQDFQAVRRPSTEWITAAFCLKNSKRRTNILVRSAGIRGTL